MSEVDTNPSVSAVTDTAAPVKRPSSDGPGKCPAPSRQTHDDEPREKRTPRFQP